MHADSEVPGRQLSYLGYVEAYVLKQLVYVDTQDEENETYVVYYWRDGMLVSALEGREGGDTMEEGTDEIFDIYNFEDQRLVSWTRDGEPIEDVGFYAESVGNRVLRESIQRGEPIYEKIGAD